MAPITTPVQVHVQGHIPVGTVVRPGALPCVTCPVYLTLYLTLCTLHFARPECATTTGYEAGQRTPFDRTKWLDRSLALKEQYVSTQRQAAFNKDPLASTTLKYGAPGSVHASKLWNSEPLVAPAKPKAWK